MNKAAFILSEEQFPRIYPQEVLQELKSICEVQEFLSTADFLSRSTPLPDVEILFSGWGCPKLDEAALANLPSLKLVLYGAGSLKSVVTDAFWQKDIPICSAWVANAVPVAEFSFAQIILGLKQVLRLPGIMRETKRRTLPEHFEDGGAFHTNVSLISLGQIGRFVAEHLKSLDVNVLAYDPFVSQAEAESLGVTLVSLEEAFSASRVVSLHTPWLPETEGMITGDLLRSIPPGGTFINTARGAVVRENELIEVMQQRPDLTAVLDVTYPEPPAPDSPLYTLENVFLTPHIAGSVAGECGRMGQYMLEELKRWQHGEPLRYQVTNEAFRKMA